MRILLFTILLFCVVCCPFKATASHVSGTELSYVCTATPGVFEVTLILYIRCSSLTTAICPSPCGSNCIVSLPIVGVDSGYAGVVFAMVPLQLQNVRDVDKKLTCPNVKNTCTHSGCVVAGTFSPGIERYEFKGLANLGPASGIPAGCCNIKIPYQACCRSSYSWGADQNYYNDISINRCHIVSPCNNSPAFKNEPRVVVTGGENFMDNWGATDPDHDSLSYSFAPLLTAQGAPVGYPPPFAYNKPMPWTGSATGLYPQGIHCDPLSGDVTFTPPNAGTPFYGAICIAVNEWKTINGIPTLISTVRRDIEMTVMPSSPNNPPRLVTNPPESGNANIPKTLHYVSAGEQLCFTVTTKDTDFNLPFVSDTTYMRWDSTLVGLGATFLPDYDPLKRHLPDSLGGGPREDRYRFCWTPDDSLISSIPYYFTVKAMDKRCPTPGELTRAFSVVVAPKISAQIVKKTGTCQNILLSYNNLNPSVNIVIGLWRIAKTSGDSLFTNGYHTYIATTTPTPFEFKDSGRYYIQLLVNGAGLNGTPGALKTYTDYVDATGITLQDSIDAYDPSCALIPNGKIILKGYNGAAPYQYKLNSQPYTFNHIFPNLMAGQYIVLVKDSNGCESSDTVTLTPPPQLTNTVKIMLPTCFNDSNGSISINTTGGKPPYTYQVSQQTFGPDSVFNGLAAGSYRIMVKDNSACIKTDSVELPNPPPLSATYLITHASCFNWTDGKIKITPATGLPDLTYSLNQGQQQASPLFDNLGSGKYVITLTDSNACSHSDSITVTQPSVLTYVKHKTAITCYNAADATLSIVPGGGTPPYQLIFDSVVYPIPSTLSMIGPGVYHYHFTDSKYCPTELTDTFENPHQITAGPVAGDSSVALYSTHTYTAPLQPGLSAVWIISGGTLVSSSVAPPTATVRWDTAGSGTVGIVAYSSVTCADTAWLQVNIGSVGMDDISESPGVSIYPNPAKNTLQVNLQQLPEQKNIQLYDIHGRVLIDQEARLQQELNIETLAPGMYLLKIGAWSGQVIKE